MFTEGNQYYKIRSKDGRDLLFETPEILANACNEYFEWCINNPHKEVVLTTFQGVSKLEDVPKMRTFSLEGLCNFIDISVKGFKLYEDRIDFIPVTTRARRIIYNQQFEGASSGFLNPSIIARSLGLKESFDHTTNGKDVVSEKLDLSHLTIEELKQLQQLQSKVNKDA